MRAYWATILLILTLPLGELHSYFNRSTVVQNWIVNAYKPMPLPWNVKYAEGQFIIILYFLAWLYYKPNKLNRTTVIAFFWLAILDTVLYFYDFKTGNFGRVYFWFAGFWLLSYNWVPLTDWLIKKGKNIKVKKYNE